MKHVKSFHKVLPVFAVDEVSPQITIFHTGNLLFIRPDHTDGLGSHCEWLIQATPSLCLSFTVHNKNAFYKCLSAWPYLFHYWISSHFCYSSSQDYVVISVRCSEPPLYWQSCPALCDQSVASFHAKENTCMYKLWVPEQTLRNSRTNFSHFTCSLPGQSFAASSQLNLQHRFSSLVLSV